MIGIYRSLFVDIRISAVDALFSSHFYCAENDLQCVCFINHLLTNH